MLVDLIGINNSEGLRLDGAFFSPTGSNTRQGLVDAVLLIHGSRGNFCDPATVAMAEALRSRGYAALALNTNAHDTVWFNLSDGVYKGNAFEILDHTRLDLKAGVDYLWDSGYRNIALLGHSMGAVRVTYYAALEEDPRVAGIIPVSPVRLSYSYYMTSEDAEEFQSNVRNAQDMVAQGKEHELVSVKFPITQLFSAASYLDKHGPEERYNLLKLAPQIRVPMLALAGSLETHTRLRDMARDLAEAAVNSHNVEWQIIDGGDHSLNNSKEEAAEAVLKFLASLVAQEVST